jgi:hypothetical protein
MLGLDSEIGTSALRLWVLAGSAALLVACCMLALLRHQSDAGANPLLRAGFLVVGAVLGGAMTWAFLARDGASGGNAERRALEMRVQELSVQALAPGSPLACLDAVVGESVEAACERLLFASPANVATASSYVAARLSLLSRLANYDEQGGEIGDVLPPLRHALEADPFGFLAHVLMVRDGCTDHSCKAFALLHDASRVRANLSAETFDRYLDHYLPLWPKTADGAVADAAPVQPAAPAQGPRKMTIIADFPSAASIPAVSIMTAEPSGPVLPGVAAAAAANPNGQPSAGPSARHSRKQAANPTPQTTAQSLPSGSPAGEPIWPEPVPSPPPSPTAPGGAGPVQLAPPPPAGASAGGSARAQ